jgi:hypothetical protein
MGEHDELVLEGALTRAAILPAAGARVQQVEDRRTGRSLLYARRPEQEGADDYLTATTGGWDLLFPNDETWRGHPDHGRAWNAPFEVGGRDANSAELVLELDAPRATVTRTYSLLPPPRSGLREEVRIDAGADTGPCLVASHPMLAVEPGWRIELAAEARELAADADYPGRFGPGQALGPAEWAVASVVPSPSPMVVEVLYVEGIADAAVASPDGRARTRVAWTADRLPYLWICVITGRFGDDGFVILEPSAARPYRLDEAMTAGAIVELRRGQSWTGAVELESLDAVAGESR